MMTTTDKIKVTIDRAKWRTGFEGCEATGRGDTALKNEEGFMCCLGFISIEECKQAGYTIDPFQTMYPWQVPEMELIGSTLVDDPYPTPGKFSIAILAARINDKESTTVTEKEAELKILFADTEYELEFVGEPVPYVPDDDSEGDEC